MTKPRGLLSDLGALLLTLLASDSRLDTTSCSKVRGAKCTAKPGKVKPEAIPRCSTHVLQYDAGGQ